MKRHFKVFSISSVFVASVKQKEELKLNSRSEIGTHKKVTVIWLMPGEPTPAAILWMLVENG